MTLEAYATKVLKILYGDGTKMEQVQALHALKEQTGVDPDFASRATKLAMDEILAAALRAPRISDSPN